MDSETQKEEVDQSKVTIASVIRLIDSIDFEHLKLDKHREVCLGINEIVTENSVDLLDEHFIDRVLEYLKILICMCDGHKFLGFAKNAITKFPLSKLESSLSQLISSRKDELESELNPEWHQHQNMCAVIEKVLKAYRDSLEQTVIDQMFDYCSKLLRKCENSKLISRCFCAFSQFPLSKLESSLSSMIETLKSELKTTKQQQSKWYLHDNMSGVIYEVLDECQESLNQAVIDQMFAYLAELIHRCANGELISNSFEAFGKFSLIKLQSSLPQLIRSMEDQLECDQCTEWFPHDNFGSAMQFVLMAHSMLYQNIIEQMCEYCTKLFHSCEDGQRIEYALGVFAQFPPSKLQTSLTQLIRSMENKLESGQSSTEWFKHENVCIAIQDILDLHCTTLPQELINQIFAYLTKLMFFFSAVRIIISKRHQLHSRKFRSKELKFSLSKMINESTESQKYQNVSFIIEEVLNVHRDSLDSALVDRMFDYCTKPVGKRQVASMIAPLEIITRKSI